MKWICNQGLYSATELGNRNKDPRVVIEVAPAGHPDNGSAFLQNASLAALAKRPYSMGGLVFVSRLVVITERSAGNAGDIK